MAGMLQVLLGLSENVAATATLLIRFFTLWFGVGLGVLTVLIWRKLFFESRVQKIETGQGARDPAFAGRETAYERTS
jgi:hypothetical protein